MFVVCVFFYFVPSLLISMFFVSSIWVRCFAADSTEVWFCLAPKRKRRNLSACVFFSTLYSTLCVVCLRGAREREHQSLFEMYVRERKPKHNHSSAAWITCDLCVTPYVRYCVAVAASAAAGYVFSVDIRLLCGHFSVNAFHQNICICLNDERVTAQCQ